MKRTPEELELDVEIAKAYVRSCRWQRRRRERRLDAVVKVMAVVATLMAYGALVCAATVVWLG